MNRDETDSATERLERPSSLARWVAATICIVYGFAKINGAQFTVLDSERTKPLDQVSGFWLTWYYFGYSTIYGATIALIQIIGGMLLVFPRTILLGALILLPIITNILLIDIFYGVDLGGTLTAVVVTYCLLAVISAYETRLRRVIFLGSAAAPSRTDSIALTVVVLGAFAFTAWAANYNNRAPTPIDGIWSVVAQTGDSLRIPRWSTVFFERNRAGMVVFRTADGVDETHHFEVGKDGRVLVWQTWLAKGALIMQGRQHADGQLELEIRPPSGGRLTLQRVSDRH